MPDEPPAKSSKAQPKKHPRGGLVGPLFSWELFRLARRGQDARGRFILAFLLFLVLTAFSMIWFRNTAPSELFFGDSQKLSIAETSAFGASFSLTFLIAQKCPVHDDLCVIFGHRRATSSDGQRYWFGGVCSAAGAKTYFATSELVR